MTWAVSIDTVTLTSPTDEQIDILVDALRAYGAAVSVSVDRVGCTMTTSGANTLDAGERATRIWRDRLLDVGIVPGIDIALEAMTTDEQDRRLGS